ATGRRGPSFPLSAAARGAGVAPGTLVARFGSKHGLLLALARAGAERAVAAMRAAAAGAPAGAPALRAALLAAAEPLADPATAPNHLGQLGADLADPALRAAVAEQMAAMRAELERLVRAAPDLPGAPAPARAAEALLALWNGVLLTWSLAPAGPLDRRLRRDLDTLIDAWRAE